MSEKIYLNLLILCGILCQGINATFSVEDIRESSNYLVRKKRVVHGDSEANIAVPIEDVPYVVNIKKQNKNHCVGSILSRYSVITVAHCVREDESMYKVFSGSSSANGGIRHNVIAIRFRFNGDRDRGDGIALINVSPPFVFSETTKPIHLHSEPLMPGILATVSGWGVVSARVETQHRLSLRAITVPIMRHQDCVNSYLGVFNITEKHICTHGGAILKCCGNTDGGAPLVVNHLLAGVYILRRDVLGSPDVFVLLQHAQFNEWIRRNIVR